MMLSRMEGKQICLKIASTLCLVLGAPATMVYCQCINFLCSGGSGSKVKHITLAKDQRHSRSEIMLPAPGETQPLISHILARRIFLCPSIYAKLTSGAHREVEAEGISLCPLPCFPSRFPEASSNLWLHSRYRTCCLVGVHSFAHKLHQW